jgi:hypothetical protein
LYRISFTKKVKQTVTVNPFGEETLATEIMTGVFDTTPLIQYLLVIILVVLISTRVYTTICFYVLRYRISRPPIPYSIPWIGDLLEMSSSLTKYICGVRLARAPDREEKL